MTREYINLPDAAFSVPLDGKWRGFRKVYLKTALTRDEGGGVNVIFYVDGVDEAGNKRRVKITDLVFEKGTTLEKLARVCMVMALLMREVERGWMLDAGEARYYAMQVMKEAVASYPLLRRRIMEREGKHG